MTVRKLKGSAIQTGTITSTQLSGALNSSISAGGGPRVSSLIYPGDDTAANTAGGQTVYINGSGFETNNAIYINGNAVPSKSFISSSNLSFTTPALSAATYPVYVINTDTGATAIFIPGLEISGEPTWSTSATLPEQGADDTWNISLSATSDSNVTYSLAGGSSLPSGISLAANGLISGTLSSPPNEDTTYSFTVVAADEENQDASRAFSVNVTVGEGVAFANTVLLLHADGTNNQNNHTFLDSSNNNLTITRAGNATQGSFSPFSQTGWSGYFDGANDSLQITSSSSLDFPNDFTIECWVYLNVLEDNMRIFNRQVFNSSPNIELITKANGSLSLRFNATADPLPANTLSATGVIQANKWHHIAVVRNGSDANNVSLYVDGNSAITFTNTANHNPSADFYIGNYPGLDRTPNGYISNFRIVKGTAVYTSAFTPPTAPLTNIANTSLLTLQSNRFVDNSNNNFAITRNGDTRIVPYSPFAPTSKYTTANVGGSAYFDGSGDYLSVPYTTTNFNWWDSDFTIECWINIPSYSGYDDSKYHPVLIGNRNPTTTTDYWSWGPATDGKLRLYYFNGSPTNGVSSGNTIPLNAWTHIAFVKDSNGTRNYINGVLEGTAAVSGTPQSSGTVNLVIGAGNNNYFTGNISNLRIVKGTALYTEAFTPPTEPLTNIANTSLLLNFTNAGIFDQTAKHVIETIGDAKISTSVVKYGTGSIAFDGTGDYLEVKENKQLFNFGTGDFTIEMWFYANASGGGLIGKGPSDSDDEMFIYLYSGVYYVDWGSTSGAYMQGGSYGLGQWNHLALVRNGTSLVLYHNGTSAVSTTLTANYNFTGNHTLKIGSARGGSFNYNGYIDDLRISRFARYTANFTPPTSAFKDR